MSRPEAWVSVTCTDRAESLRSLVGDLVAQAAESDMALVLLINDNCVQPADQRALRDLADWLVHARVSLDLVTSPVAGASIAASRRCQREQLRQRLAIAPRPSFVWMLDDDVRLDHLHWTGAALTRSPLHCHLRFLQELAVRQPELAVLIGEVCGDPPIPVFGSVVSRLVDLEANLRAMFSADPEAAWAVDASAVARLAEPDAYYDLSHAREPAPWQRPIPWLPRDRRLSTHEALVQMLADVSHIPRGAAFSRPILAIPERFEAFAPRPLRGGNAVFFDVDCCLRHEYPSVVVDGIETRRSDMIGTSRLADDGVVVRGSSFAVLHHRPRDSRWPTADELTTSLVADTLGASLARANAPGAGASAARDFIEARLQRVDAAGRALAGIAWRLRRLVDAAPAWSTPLDPVRAVADWALAAYPGARDGGLSPDLASRLIAGATADGIIGHAGDSTGGRAA